MKVNEVTKAFLEMYRERKAQGLPNIYRRDLQSTDTNCQTQTPEPSSTHSNG